MTIEQLEIYGKQKERVSEIKEDKVIVQKRAPEEEGFEKVDIPHTRKEEQHY